MKVVISSLLVEKEAMCAAPVTSVQDWKDLLLNLEDAHAVLYQALKEKKIRKRP